MSSGPSASDGWPEPEKPPLDESEFPPVEPSRPAPRQPRGPWATPEPSPPTRDHSSATGRGDAEEPRSGSPFSTGSSQSARYSTPAASGTQGTGPTVPREEPRVGELLFEYYMVEKLLGRGGMGSVWLVRHTELDERRALKLIIPEHEFDPQLLARFRQEAKLMAKLRSKHAVTVHGARISPSGAYIEMEYLNGRALNDEIQRGQPMPPRVVAGLLDQICDVLEEAHSFGIVHRDLKPSNLMLIPDRLPGQRLLKVLDFGIAKVLGDVLGDDSVKTQGDSFLGTAQYSSPEQCHHAELDGRSDIYSVGVILYELLTGFRPFEGNALKQMQDHVSKPPPPMSTRNPEAHVPPEIEAVTRRCLEKKTPADRPQSPRELAVTFRRALMESASTESHTGEHGTESTLIGYHIPGDTTGVGPFDTYVPPYPSTQTSASSYESVNITQSRPPSSYSHPGQGALGQPPGTDTGSAHPSRTRGTAVVAAPEPVVPPRSWLRPLVMVGGLLALLAAGGAIAYVVVNRKVADRPPLPPPPPPPLPPDVPELPRLPLPDARTLVERWRGQGFETEAELTTSAMPSTLLYKAGGKTLAYQWNAAGRYYLPDGFKPVAGAAADPDDGWPSRIIGPDKAVYARVPGGKFAMGLDARGLAEHDVELSGFYVKLTEVTNGEVNAYFEDQKVKEMDRPNEWVGLFVTFRYAFAERPADRKDGAGKDSSRSWKDVAYAHPAVKIDHVVATAYAAWAGGRLPTEAQWEYAARSATSGPHEISYPWGYDQARLIEANKSRTVLANLMGDDGEQLMKPIPTSEVGKFKYDATKQGVLDMAGNVREWCRDVWQAEPPSAPSGAIIDPCVLAPDTGPDTYFVVRGGSMEETRDEVNLHYRKKERGKDAKYDLGFRVVVETPYLPSIQATGAAEARR